jgi:hypothetical protein
MNLILMVITKRKKKLYKIFCVLKISNEVKFLYTLRYFEDW